MLLSLRLLQHSNREQIVGESSEFDPENCLTRVGRAVFAKLTVEVRVARQMKVGAMEKVRVMVHWSWSWKETRLQAC